MRVILAAALLLQAAPAQTDAEKMEAALKKFGDRTYVILINGEKAGTFSMKTRLEKDGKAATVVFDDQIAIQHGGEAGTVGVVEKATLDRLRLLSTRKGGKGDGPELVGTITVEGRKAAMSADDRKQTLEVSESTVGEHAVLRLVCAAEQKEGAEFKADVVSLTTERYEPGHTFRCVGKEQVEIGGKKMDAFKWKEQGEWKAVPAPGGAMKPAVRVDNTYWVSPDGYLLKCASLHDMEMVLEVK